ncbi:MAG: tRNA (guanine-N2)-dimethyltransferase [Aquificae bacterium]|nr:tRNA (guanine-N2)-dimethyltransferase [Aquificota bacterium]
MVKSYLVLERRLEKFREVLRKRQKDLTVFVENVKNEHNFSAIIRTCDAVGVLKVHYYYEGKGKLPINEGITIGAHRWVFLERVHDVGKKLKELKGEGYQVVVTWLGEDSVDFRSVDYTKPTVLVVGNELTGVSEGVLHLADLKVKIPMMGMVQSLNVSVATAVILYEAQRQRYEKGMYNEPSLSEGEIEEIIKKWAYEDVIERRKPKSD